MYTFEILCVLVAFCVNFVLCETEKNESIYCGSGETFVSKNTPSDFSSNNLLCKSVAGTQLDGACNTTRIDSSSFNESSFVISCGENGYLEGYDVYLENGNFSGQYIFIYYCCENENQTLIRNSCLSLDETAQTLQLEASSVINEVGVQFNTTSGEYSVNVTVCRLTSLTMLDYDTYDLYPAGIETKYGNSSTDYSYSSICDKNKEGGMIVSKIDSVWSGSPSYDRGMRVICQSLNNNLKFSSEISDTATRRVDMPEPYVSSSKSWISGCKNNEVLVGINSYLDANETRRYEFICYDYIGLRVVAGTCRFLTPDSWLDHSFRTFKTVQDGESAFVFRGVSAIHVDTDHRPNDRNFQYEVCMVRSTDASPLARIDGCSFSFTTQDNTSDSPIRKATFMKYRTQDVHACAKLCSFHPFCHTFSWDPTEDLSIWWNCELSYYEGNPDWTCDYDYRWITEFRAEEIVSIQCFNCQIDVLNYSKTNEVL